VPIETFIRKQLGLKAHTVTKVEETEEDMVIYIDRLGKRLLRCGLCRRRCRKVYSVRKVREWRDLSMRKSALKLRYRPRPSRMPPVRRARRGLSLSGAVGAGHLGSVTCGGETGV
jgi:hypothetical protein